MTDAAPPEAMFDLHGRRQGKTTAALGLVLRAWGHDLRAIVVQFMKADPSWGEIVSLRRLGVDVLQVGLDHWVRSEVTAADVAAAAAGFRKAARSSPAGCSTW